jgi:hypothetical protein
VTLRRLILAGAIFAAVAGLTGGLLTGVVRGRADPAIDSEEQAFLGLINAYRAQSGSGPLTLQSQLTAAADWMSGDMAVKNYFSHTDSLGRSPSQRAAAFGYAGAAGENLARGFSSAQFVFNAWKGSSGHNANMLYSAYNVIGIGRAYSSFGWYWTTDFGRVAGPAPATVTPSPAPSPAPTLTPSPTVTPSPAETPSPTPSPTAAPLGKFGDIDCDGSVGSVDALHVLRRVAQLDSDADSVCSLPADVNCDGGLDSVDALDILLFVASLPQVPAQADCPPIGSLV